MESSLYTNQKWLLPIHTWNFLRPILEFMESNRQKYLNKLRTFCLIWLFSVQFGQLVLALNKKQGDHSVNFSFIWSMGRPISSLIQKLTLIINLTRLFMVQNFLKNAMCLICFTIKINWFGRTGHKPNPHLYYLKGIAIMIWLSQPMIVLDITTFYTRT